MHTPERGNPRAVALLLGVALALSWPVFAGAQVYYTRGDDGTIHFSNARRADATVLREAPFPREWVDDAVAVAKFDAAIKGGKYDQLIAESARKHRVEPALVKAVMRAESGFRPRAVSHKGARGLMQLMPATARGLGVRNIFDPAQNIDAGARHLRVLIDQFGVNLPRVLAAYNAGASRVDRYGGIPPYAETRNYVAQVMRYRRDYLKRERIAAIGKTVRAR